MTDAKSVIQVHLLKMDAQAVCFNKTFDQKKNLSLEV